MSEQEITDQARYVHQPCQCSNPVGGRCWYPKGHDGPHDWEPKSAPIVVAEVRGASLDLTAMRRKLDAYGVFSLADAERLLAEVERLTAERDGLASWLSRDPFWVEAKKAQEALAALRVRLRGLEQHWRDQISGDVCDKWHGLDFHPFDGFCATCGYTHSWHVRKANADQLAALLATPEEPA